MKTLLSITFVLFYIGAAPSLSADVVTGPVVNPANGHSYYLLDEASWNDSQTEAVALGGHLVTINDAAENQWVFDTFSSFDGLNRNLWIGFNDSVNEGVFEWVSGEVSTYNNWNTGQPNNFDGVEDYAFIQRPQIQEANDSFSPGFWNDQDNQDATDRVLGQYFGVAEVVSIPEPNAGLAIVMFTLFPAALARRKNLRR